MNIIASAEIRLNYNNVVEKCKETGEPIYLTKNGQGELVVMDIESFEKREQELKLQQMILDSYCSHIASGKSYSTKEAMDAVNKLIEEHK